MLSSVASPRSMYGLWWWNSRNTRPLHRLAHRHVAKWHQRSDTRHLHTRERGQPLFDVCVDIEAAGIVQSAQSRVYFSQHGVVGAEAEINERRAQRHVHEQARRNEQAEGQRHLRGDERVARHEAPRARRGVVAALRLEV